MSALDRIRKHQRGGKTVDEITAENNVNVVFWLVTFAALITFVAVGIWKFFFFQTSIQIPNPRLELFLEITAAGISELFRFLSLVMAFYESKKNRVVSVWFGILLSLGIMFYDIRIGWIYASSETIETFWFLCGIGELIGIRAIFGHAFEEGINKFRKSVKLESLLFETEIVKPEISELKQEPVKPVSNKKPRVKKNAPIQAPKVIDSDSVAVDGFSKPLSASEIRSKIKQYAWKLKNGKGNQMTNDRNIEKLRHAYHTLTGETIELKEIFTR